MAYHHHRGALIDDLKGLTVSGQGFDAFSVGLALQPGWHHLLSPYAGLRYRSELTSGDMRLLNNTTRTTIRNISSFEGGRTLATAGVTLNFPPSFHGVAFKAWTLNFEYYQDMAASNLESGWSLTFGRGMWIPGRTTALPGVTALASDSDNEVNALFVPYAMWGGGGLQIGAFEQGQRSLCRCRSRLAAKRRSPWCGPAVHRPRAAARHPRGVVDARARWRDGVQ
jgi:hypothetical protein